MNQHPHQPERDRAASIARDLTKAIGEQVDGLPWWGVPFGFTPFWRRIGRYAGAAR